MNHTLKSFILVLALGVSLGVMGQDNYKKGYVITLENDTLFGKINDAGGYKNSRLCTFKPYKKHKVTEYLPGEIKGYRMYDDKYYVSKPIAGNEEGKYRFMEVVIEGAVNLYHDRKSTEKAFYIQKKNEDLIPLSYEVGQLRYKPEENIAVIYSPTYTLHNRIYKDTLRYVFNDSKIISDRVETVEYDVKSLSKLTKDYITEKCSGPNCINFERNLRIYRPRVGIYGGIQLTDIEFLPSGNFKYSNAEDHSILSKTFNTYPVGIFVNFPMPMLNDKLSFQLEVMANNMNYDEILKTPEVSLFEDTVAVSTNTIGIPLMIKYELFRGFISPSLGIGKSFNFVYDSEITGFRKDKLVTDSEETTENNALMVHPIQKGGWFGEVGISFKLSPGLSLFANARYTYFKNLIIEKGLENASYNTLYDKKQYAKEFKTTHTTLLIGLKF